MARRLALLCAVLAVVVAAGPAWAAVDQAAAEGLASQGFHVEDGAGSVAGLAAAVAETGGSIALASFASDLGDATVIAEDLGDATGVATVIVLTPFEIGSFSTVYTDSQLSAAIDVSLDAFDSSLANGYRLFVNELPGAVAPGASQTPAPTQNQATGSESSGLPVGTILLVAIVGGGLFLWWRSRSQKEKVAAERVAEAKAEVDGQLNEISNEILELSDRVMVMDNVEAASEFQEASIRFDKAQRLLEKAADVGVLEDVSEALDETRYHLDVTEALLDGKPVPAKPKEERLRCFFDPRHPRATETATLRTKAGERTVAVCEEDAAKLRRGERPEARSIGVDGHAVPAPQAPRSYGGSGFDWLDIFSVIVGGSNAIDFDLGNRGRVPQRRTVYPPRPRSSSSSTTRRTVVPGPSSTRRASRRRSSTRRSGGRASRSRGSHRAGGKASRRR